MHLSGVLYDAGGPLASVQIKFEAAKTTLNGVIVSAERIFTTQQDGTYLIELEPGYYTVSWLERGRPVRLGTIVADTDSQMSLPEALEADYTPMQPSYIQGALDQMRADLEAAQTAASTAAADVSDMLTQAVAESADRAEQEADRANTYADNAGYVTRERLRKQATLDLDFASGDYALDDGEKVRTTDAGEVLTVERAASKWVFGPNGKLREVPPNTLARQWNPATGEPEGVLIEESRTNLLMWSGDQSNAVNAKTNVNITSESGDTPLGDSFYAMTETTIESQPHRLQQPATITGGATVTSVLIAKSNGRNVSVCALDTSANSGFLATFDLETGERVGSGSDFNGGTFISSGSLEIGGGWHMIWATGIVSASGTGAAHRTELRNGNSPVYTGDGTSGIYIAHAQLEQGTRPTSPIITTDAPVTRAADYISRTLGGEWNDSGFTLLVDFEELLPGAALFDFSGEGASELRLDRAEDAHFRFFSRNVNSESIFKSIVSGDPIYSELDSGGKLAVSHENGNYVIACNGVSYSFNGSAASLGSSPDFGLFSRVLGDFANTSSLAQANIYPHAMIDTELKELTTL